MTKRKKYLVFLLIGWVFLILGVVLMLFGVFTDQTDYFWKGILLNLVAMGMFSFASRAAIGSATNVLKALAEVNEPVDIEQMAEQEIKDFFRAIARKVRPQTSEAIEQAILDQTGHRTSVCVSEPRSDGHVMVMAMVQTHTYGNVHFDY